MERQESMSGYINVVTPFLLIRIYEVPLLLPVLLESLWGVIISVAGLEVDSYAAECCEMALLSVIESKQCCWCYWWSWLRRSWLSKRALRLSCNLCLTFLFWNTWLCSPSSPEDVRTDLHKPFCGSSRILQVLQNSPFRGVLYSDVCFFDSPKGTWLTLNSAARPLMCWEDFRAGLEVSCCRASAKEQRAGVCVCSSACGVCAPQRSPALPPPGRDV